MNWNIELRLTAWLYDLENCLLIRVCVKGTFVCMLTTDDIYDVMNLWRLPEASLCGYCGCKAQFIFS